MNARYHHREQGERNALLSLIQLFCAVSIWRTGMIRILPLCGTSAWWVTLICLLPGMGVALLFRLLMRITKTATMQEALRACLGKTGMLLTMLVLSVLLLWDGVSSMTAMVTLFTEGIGTRGTQLTLAILTGVALLCSLHRQGLPRAVCLIGWGMTAAAVIVAVLLLQHARLDSLFPLQGNGEAAVFAAIRAGLYAGWPIVLLLTVEAPLAVRARRGVTSAFSAVAALLLLSLTIPHEVLIRREGLAGHLLLTTAYIPNALRVLTMCLVLLSFFFSIAAAVQQSSLLLCSASKKAPAWVSYAVLIGVCLTQAAEIPTLWYWLGRTAVWLPALLTGCAAAGLIAAFGRRLRT